MTDEKGIGRRRGDNESKESNEFRVCVARERCSAINVVSIHKADEETEFVRVCVNGLVLIEKK